MSETIPFCTSNSSGLHVCGESLVQASSHTHARLALLALPMALSHFSPIKLNHRHLAMDTKRCSLTILTPIGPQNEFSINTFGVSLERYQFDFTSPKNNSIKKRKLFQTFEKKSSQNESVHCSVPRFLRCRRGRPRRLRLRRSHSGRTDCRQVCSR